MKLEALLSQRRSHVDIQRARLGRHVIGADLENAVHRPHIHQRAPIRDPATGGGVVGADRPHRRWVLLWVSQHRDDIVHVLDPDDGGRVRGEVALPVTHLHFVMSFHVASLPVLSRSRLRWWREPDPLHTRAYLQTI